MMEGTKHMILDWTSALQTALTTLLQKISFVLPNLLGALIILILGSLVAMLLSGLVGTGIKKLKLDIALEKTLLYPVSENLGIKLNTSRLFSELVKWFVLIIVFIAAADIANLTQVTDFFNEVLLYLPNVFVAVIILLVASLLANFVANLITTSFKDELGYLSGIAKVAIFTFAILAALNQLQISRPLVEILFTGIVATGVLAFGLGGKDVAGDIVKKIYDDFQTRKRR
ncbi:MAG: hypothetical protein HYY52_07075 [Candidatus Melainabacteria bacterium]|nr:hypothetical protein [Candidatus Melainabacteria bacterium]